MYYPKGYATNTGYKGYIPRVGYMLFSTEEDYLEYLKELEGE